MTRPSTPRWFATRGALAGFALLLGALAGCPDDSPAGPEPVEHAGVIARERRGVVTLENGQLRVAFDLGAGTFGIAEAGGARPWLASAEARARYRQDGAVTEIATSDPGTRTFSAAALDDALGSGVRLEVWHAPADPAAPRLRVSFGLRAGDRHVTVAAAVAWPAGAGADVRVERLSPLAADPASGGALFVGPDPRTHRVLDNGSDLYFDFEARVGALGDSISLLFPPGQVANWTTALYDPATGESVVGGFLTARRGVGLVALDYQRNVAISEDGRDGFTRFEAFSHYAEGRAPTEDTSPAPGERGLGSELFTLELGPETPFDGLEAWADRHAAWHGKTLFDGVPTGWNSWGGGAGSGGYGTTIDATLMLANLTAEASDFLPYGMEHFMIDDGWQRADGDWWPRQDRFPDRDGRDGMAWFADRVRERGMIPGLWISPYTVDHTSELAAAHPDWLAEISPLGSAAVPDDKAVLDLSHPEVQGWIGETFGRLAEEWGYRFLKMDFSYYAFFTQNLYDPDVTPTEAYRTALDRIREAIGPETFLLTISATGPCLEVADGGRITLDNEPWWTEGNHVGAQGILTTYVTTARRYYLNHRAWVNHPDLLFFRDDYGLTLEEARTWSSAVAITGGLVKLGERYLELHDRPDWRALVTPLLPVYPRSGRPLDLFERFYPERWLLPVTREGRQWWVLGLFHWGPNRGFETATFEAEAPRTHALPLETLGLDPTATWLALDAWEHTYAWITDGLVEETLAPRTARVLVLREAPTEPAVALTSRHLLGGAVEVHDEAWDATSRTLTFRVDAAPGDPLTVLVADAGMSLVDVTVVGAPDVTSSQQDGVVTLELLPESPGVTLTIELQ